MIYLKFSAPFIPAKHIEERWNKLAPTFANNFKDDFMIDGDKFLSFMKNKIGIEGDMQVVAVCVLESFVIYFKTLPKGLELKHIYVEPWITNFAQFEIMISESYIHGGMTDNYVWSHIREQAIKQQTFELKELKKYIKEEVERIKRERS